MSIFSKAAKKLKKGLKTMHLDSVAAQLDFKKMITNPKGYVKDMGKAYGKDIAFAGSVWSRFKQGDFKGLGKQAFSETAQAFGASKAQQQKAATAGELAGKAYGVYAKNADTVKELAAKAQDGGGSMDFGALLSQGKAALQDAAKKKAVSFFDDIKKQGLASVEKALKGTKGTPLAKAPAVQLAKDDKASLLKAAVPAMGAPAGGWTRETWAAVAARPETLGGLFGV